MKKSGNQVQALLALVGVLIAVAAYFLIYQKYNEQAENIETQNVSLQSEYNRLSQLAAQQEQYETETASMQSYIKDFETQFPANILPEDTIMMVDTLESSTRTDVATLSWTEPTEVAYTAEGTTDATATDTTTDTATTDTAETTSVVTDDTGTTYYDSRMCAVSVGASLECTYDDFKGLVRYLYNQKNRMTIRSVSIAYNTADGMLSGSMNLDTYCLTGTDKVYSPASIPNMQTGVDTIFGEME